jgi:signal transduction histidine kinase
VPEKPFILYIEDDSNSRNLVSRVLNMSYEVQTAQNGLEGLTAIQRRLPDLVLTDLNLPDLSGEVIAARIRAMTEKPIPIVAITAQTDKAFKNRAMAAGCIGYITKPIDVATLPTAIESFLQGHVETIDEADHKRATQELQANMSEMLEATLRQVQEDNAALRNLDRVKTAFLTQVSHELRTPLTVLSGYVQMLHQMMVEGQPVTASHKEMSALAVDGTKRLHNLMNEIVVMARLASNQLDAHRAPLRIDDSAREAIEEYRGAFTERNITLDKTGEGWNEVLLADSTLIRMALSNLISNAIKATPDGGKITLSAAVEKDRVHITLQDTGVGIDPENLSLLFKPFFTTIDVSRGKTSKTQFMGMGMGMGLTIVTKIVETHRGQVWAESASHNEQTFPGSTFHLLLPLAQSQLQPSTADVNQGTQAAALTNTLEVSPAVPLTPPINPSTQP